MLSKKSLDLILEFEVGGGENYYNKFNTYLLIK